MDDNQISEELTYLKSATGQKLVDFPVKDLTILYKRNVRDDLKTYDEDNPKMVKLVNSMKTEGYHLGQPILVHKNTVALNGNTNNEVLKGHRRATAARYAKLLTVPAIVISGLTEEQKMKIIVEAPPVAINKIGEFKAVQALKGKMGDQRIADAIGIKKNAVQEWRYLDALPQPLQEMWYSHIRGVKTAFPVGRPAILALHAAKLRDHEGITLDALGVESPPMVERIDLNPLGGPEYRKVFDRLVNEGIAPTTTVSKKTLNDTADGIKDDVVRTLIYGLADKPGVDRGKAIDTALDLTGRMQRLLRLVIKEPHLAMLINFPETSDPALDKARQDTLVTFISNAVELVLAQDPDLSPLVQWAKDDANKVKYGAYEGALPPAESTPPAESVPAIDVVVTPEPEVIKVTSESGVTTAVRADSAEVSDEPVSDQPVSKRAQRRAAKSKK